jgi:soluble lytic murein transglycosylase-like protein
MGATARDMGFDGSFLTALCDPFTGLEYGCRYLRSLIKRYGWDQRAGVAAYNAGSAVRKPDGTFKNQDYVDAVAKFGGF